MEGKAEMLSVTPVMINFILLQRHGSTIPHLNMINHIRIFGAVTLVLLLTIALIGLYWESKVELHVHVANVPMCMCVCNVLKLVDVDNDLHKFPHTNEYGFAYLFIVWRRRKFLPPFCKQNTHVNVHVAIVF